MPIRSLSRCAAISTSATLWFLFISAGPVRPSFQDGKASTAQANTAQQAAVDFEVSPFPPDLAPNARTDPELARSIEIRAWADKAEFKQLEPVVIHYEWTIVSKGIVKISGVPAGLRSIDVEVTSGADIIPRTRYGTLPRTWRTSPQYSKADDRQEITFDTRHSVLSKSRRVNPGKWPAIFDQEPVMQDKIAVNLLRDMTNPGLYEVKVVLPVYNADFTAKARASSRTIEVRILKASEY